MIRKIFMYYMNYQNILNNNRPKSDITIDSSELYDFIVEDSIKIDATLDFSQFYDFELVPSVLLDVKLDSSELYDFTLYFGDINYSEEMMALIDNYLLTENLEPLLTEDSYNLFY